MNYDEEAAMMGALTDLYATPEHTVVEPTAKDWQADQEWSIAGELDGIRHDLIALRAALIINHLSPYWESRLNGIIERVTRLDGLFK